MRGRVRRFRRGNFAASRRGAARAGTGAPFSAREFLRRAQRGNAPAGRGVLLCLPHGLHPQGAACRFGKREVPARGGALNLLSSCAIGASSLGHSMSLQCEGTPSWERGKKKIRTKTGTSLLPLAARRRAALLGQRCKHRVCPSPSRVFPRAPFPLNPLPLVDFSCGRTRFALLMITRGRIGYALLVGLHRDRAEG